MTKEVLQEIISEVISLLQNQIKLLQSEDAVTRNDVSAIKVEMAEVRVNLKHIEKVLDEYIGYITKEENVAKEGSSRKWVAFITGILGLLTGAIVAYLNRK